jgi:hypothetical protein
VIHLDIGQRMCEDGAKMYEWFDRIGDTVNCAMLRREFSDFTFRDFESWAKAQDWKRFFKALRTSAPRCQCNREMAPTLSTDDKRRLKWLAPPSRAPSASTT